MAVEFAGIVNGRGSEFTLVYRGPQILRGFDDDVRNTLAGDMVKKGIKVVVETTIDRIEKRGEALHLHLSDGSVIEADAAMAATGRKPNVENLGLEQVGVARSEEHTSELQSLMRNSYAVFCLK